MPDLTEAEQALLEAVRADDIGGIRAALAAGADVNARLNASDYTALHFAAKHGFHLTVEYLLDRGADQGLVTNVSLRRGPIRTPLDVAITSGRTQVVAALLSSLAKRPSELYWQHKGALKLVKTHRNIEIQGLLENFSFPSEVTLSLQLIDVLNPAHYDEVLACIEQGADPLFSLKERGSLLHLAADQGCGEDILSLLCEHGCDIDGRAKHHRNTPLHRAASIAYPETVQSLLRLGADPTALTSYTAPPWLLALSAKRTNKHPRGALTVEDSIEVLDLLYNANGGFFDDPDRENWALSRSVAPSGCHFSVLEHLFRLGANPNSRPDETQPTLFHQAVWGRSAERVRIMIEAGATIEHSAPPGLTVIHDLIKNGREIGPEMVEILASAGVDIDAPARVEIDTMYPHPFRDRSDWQGATALHLAAASYMWLSCESLIRHGADHTLRNANGRTPRNFVAKDPWHIASADRVGL